MHYISFSCIINISLFYYIYYKIWSQLTYSHGVTARTHLYVHGARERAHVPAHFLGRLGARARARRRRAPGDAQLVPVSPAELLGSTTQFDGAEAPGQRQGPGPGGGVVVSEDQHRGEAQLWTVTDESIIFHINKV